MSIYLLGYIGGVNKYSWCASFFQKDLPLDVRMTRKEVMDCGYFPFLGIGNEKIESCDYYIARAF